MTVATPGKTGTGALGAAAGAGILVGGSAETLEKGIEKAKEAIDSGEAMNKLESLRNISQDFKAV